MRINFVKSLFIFFVSLNSGLFGNSAAGANYVTLSQVKHRVLAMGGAFAAVSDNVPAFMYNPATFSQYKYPKKVRLTFYVNPIAAGVSLNERCLFRKEKTNALDVIKSLSLLFKAVTISLKSLEGGVLLFEESLANQAFVNRKKFFSSRSFWLDYSNSVSVRLKLAPQVALGVTTTFYSIKNATRQRWEVGTNYGVLLRPDRKIAVGVFYLAMPKRIADHRIVLERLTNDTINLGFAYQPNSATTFAIDLRNITQEKDSNSREIHLGFEQIFQSWFAFRAGFFQPAASRRCYSAGIGFLSADRFFKLDKHFKNKYFLLNYSFVNDVTDETTQPWHFFAFTLRF